MKPLRILSYTLAILSACLATACVRAEPSLFEPERALAEVSGATVRHFWTRDFGREKRTGGYSALVPETTAKAMLLKLREQIPAGYVAFVGTSRNLDDPSIKGVELVLAPGKDQFDILRLAATDGINYGLATEDIVTRLKKWDQQFGICIWQAETDTVQMEMKSRPLDLRTFSKDLYEFCPDIVDQGVGDLESLERELRNTGAIYLWWD